MQEIPLIATAVLGHFIGRHSESGFVFTARSCFHPCFYRGKRSLVEIAEAEGHIASLQLAWELGMAVE